MAWINLPPWRCRLHRPNKTSAAILPLLARCDQPPWMASKRQTQRFIGNTIYRATNSLNIRDLEDLTFNLTLTLESPVCAVSFLGILRSSPCPPLNWRRVRNNRIYGVPIYGTWNNESERSTVVRGRLELVADELSFRRPWSACRSPNLSVQICSCSIRAGRKRSSRCSVN